MAQAVYRLERAIGGPVEAAVHSDTYFDVVSQVNRARARAIGAVEGVSRRGLHLLNLPAGTDIRRVREQLARMERRLNALTDELAAARMTPGTGSGEPGDGAVAESGRPRSGASTATSSGRTCGPATASATCAGRTGRSWASTPKDVVWRAARRSCGATAADRACATGPPLLIVTASSAAATSSTCRPGNSTVEFLRERRPRRLHARLGRPRRARRRQQPRDLRRRVPAARAGRGAARDRLRRGHARRLLPRRRASPCSTPAGHDDARRAQPDPDGDADRLRRDGRRWSPRCARAGSIPRTSSTRPATCRPTSSTAGSSCSRRRRRSRSGRRCSSTSGTTSSCEGFQAMAQWTRDHVPFPGAAFRQVVELLVRRERADERVAPRRRPRDRRSRRPRRRAHRDGRSATPSCRGRRPSPR